jgi:hypothetical protein
MISGLSFRLIGLLSKYLVLENNRDTIFPHALLSGRENHQEDGNRNGTQQSHPEYRLGCDLLTIVVFCRQDINIHCKGESGCHDEDGQERLAQAEYQDQQEHEKNIVENPNGTPIVED